jgi:hypothetical protein
LLAGNLLDSRPGVVTIVLSPSGRVTLHVHRLEGLPMMRNVFETIPEFGHDEGFAPVETGQFVPTEAPAGSAEKLEVLARRLREGLPLWHSEDRADYSGLTGDVRRRVHQGPSSD